MLLNTYPLAHFWLFSISAGIFGFSLNPLGWIGFRGSSNNSGATTFLSLSCEVYFLDVFLLFSTVSEIINHSQSLLNLMEN